MHVPLGDTYEFKFTSRNTSGVPTTLSGTPVISIYEENNLVQITAGITLTADYDSVTGLNHVAIVATSGNGYEVGKYYNAVITTGTVGGGSVVGEVVGHFRVMAAENVAGVPVSDASYVSGTSQTANDNGADINAILDDTGTSGVVLANNAISSSKVAVNAFSNSVFTTGYFNSINAECDTALADYDAPTKAEMDAAFAALNDLSAAEVNAEVLDVIQTDTFAELSSVPAATSSLKDKLTWVFMLARNQLEQTATTTTLRRDDGTTAAASASVSDDGTTATRGEFT